METELWTRLNLVYIVYNLYFMCMFYLPKYGNVYIKLGSSMPIKEHPLLVENHYQNGSHFSKTRHLHGSDDSLSKFHKEHTIQ